MSFLPHFRTVTNSLSAGLVGAIRSLALATLIFGGLGLNEARAFGPVLIGAGALGLIMSFRSGLVGTPQSNSAAIVAVASALIVHNSSGSPDDDFALVMATVAVASLGTGISLYLGGAFKLGRLVRFLPYPVVAGFLAATGYLLLVGGWRIAQESDNLWIPLVSLVLGLGLAAMGRSRHAWAQPILLTAAIVGFFVALGLAGLTLDEAGDRQWLIGPFDARGFVPRDLLIWTTADMRLLLPGIPTLLTIPGLAALSLLLNASGIEISQRTQLSLDDELKSAGLANFGAGIVGGLPGWQSITLQQLVASSKKNPVGAVIVSSLSIGVVFLGPRLLGFIPLFVVGGVILGLGVDLVFNWLIRARSAMTTTDYLIAVSVVAATIGFGFVTGVIVGVMAAVVLFLVEYSNIAVVHSSVSGTDYRSNVDRPEQDMRALQAKGAAIEIVRLHGFVFFGTADRLVGFLRSLLKPGATRYLILDGTRITGLDGSAVHTMERFFSYAADNEVKIVLTEFGKHRFEQPGLQEFDNLDEGLEWTEDQILGAERSLFREVDEQLHELGGPWAQELKTALVRVEFAEGDTIIAEGSVGHPIHIIESGAIRVALDEGTKRVRSIRPGAIVGEMSYYTRQPANASVIAETPVIAYQLTVDKLDDLLNTNPALAAELHRRVARIMARRVASTNAALRKAME